MSDKKFAFEKTWASELADCIETCCIYDMMSSNMSPWETLQWAQSQEENIKNYLGGAGWDRSVAKMSMTNHAFKNWYKEVGEDEQPEAQRALNAFTILVDFLFEKKWDDFISELEKSDFTQLKKGNN